ncbi:MAG: FAD-dependent oxidoreductase [Bacteroidetes bacterium]|nr:FAD-dependent oxidoreductase [Bacteroidota bacterium]
MSNTCYDVIVAGGGTAGFIAAAAAGRKGMKTLLIEKNSHLGGTLAMGIPLLGVFDGNSVQVAKGMVEEFVQRLIQEQGAVGHVHGARWSNKGHMQGDAFSLTPFDSEIGKYVAQEMVLETGAEILLHTSVSGVNRENNRVKSVVVTNKSGTYTLEASVFVDATGDADLCSLAGAEMLPKTKVQNSSILFVMNRVDTERLAVALEKGDNLNGWGWWHSRLVRGEKIDTDKETFIHIAGHFKPWENEESEVTFTAVSIRENEVCLNATRTVNIDATNAQSLTDGEISERRNIKRLVDGLRKNVPGFEKAYVSKTAALGIRESRTVLCDYVITGDDVFNHSDFPDSVVRGAYPSDIHDPKGGITQFIFIKDGQNYGIPYRCFLPKDIDGLLVVGRSISATQKANGTVRLQGTVMAQGQAVGTAAALAVTHGISPRNIDVQELRKDLLSQGAVI